LWHAGNAEEEAPYLRGLEQGLQDLGYIDGRTIKLEQRASVARLRQLMQRLALRIDGDHPEGGMI
jgi:hypothetical protein